MGKYQLPPTHPAFLASTFAGLLQERYEDLYVEMSQLQETLKGALTSGEEAPLRARLESVLRALQEPVEVETGDSLIDEWERDLAEGREPDLTKGMKKKR